LSTKKYEGQKACPSALTGRSHPHLAGLPRSHIGLEPGGIRHGPEQIQSLLSVL